MQEGHDRFWSKVDKSAGPDGCWEWTGYRYRGYGKFRHNGKSTKAHRVSLELSGHDIGALHVMHACDNPGCVNPSHLRTCTHAQNMSDRDTKDRVRHGDAHPYSKLTRECVRQLRILAKIGISVSELARMFGVSQPTARKAVLGITWKRSVQESPLELAKA